MLSQGSLQLLECILDASNTLNDLFINQVLLLQRSIELSTPGCLSPLLLIVLVI